MGAVPLGAGGQHSCFRPPRAYRHTQPRERHDSAQRGNPGRQRASAGRAPVCAVLGPEERDEILFAFLRGGLRVDDSCRCFVDDIEPGAIRRRAIGEAGVDAPPANRFDVRPASEVYLESGTFSIDHMISVLSDSLDEAAGVGSGTLRVTGEMPWPGVQLQEGGVGDFFLYEAAVNDVVHEKPAMFMCMYDLTRFGVDMLVAALKTHPIVLLDRTVIDNPHYLPRDQYEADAATRTDVPPLGAVSAEPPAPDPWPTLTPGEVRAAELVARGLTNKEVARELVLSPHTIDAHLKHVYTKLGIHSRVELTVLAMQHRATMS